VRTVPTEPAADDRQPQREPSSQSSLLIGTRGSKLALWQTEWVLARLRAAAPRAPFAVATIKTQGDRTQASGAPLAGSGDKGVFVAELERALLARELDIALHPMQDLALAQAEAAQANPAVDLAVHSAKDLPSRITAGLVIAAVPPREDPRDALISRAGYTLDSLPRGAVVATSSLRRQAQLLHRRPDLRIVSVRGNVDTRLAKAMASDGPDAMVLAAAGLKRLGLEQYIREYLPVDEMIPAAGQGALAVELRAGDTHLRRMVRAIDDPATHRAVKAERTVLAALGGGCMVPLGAHAWMPEGGELLRLIAVVATPDGKRLLRATREGPATRPVALGRAVARDLIRQGADEIIRAVLAGRGNEL
jgi:hydroxymethylbilane synthase